jgi:hypothetical protein
MHEYRERLIQQQRLAPPAPQSSAKAPIHTIDALVAQFAIPDMAIQARRQSTATTDEEYRSYVNGDLWEEDSDPLTFWHVCTTSNSGTDIRCLLE